VVARPAADLVELARDAEAAYRFQIVEPNIALEPSDPNRNAARLSDRLGRQIPVPDLRRWGFRLVGEALLATDRGRAVQLDYADTSGRRVSCLFRLRPVSADASLSYREKDGVVTAYGADNDLGYSMSGRMPRRELASIADEVYGRDNP
jgi:anti-sigma factor RsiW